jgi:hypothetical protein
MPPNLYRIAMTLSVGEVSGALELTWPAQLAFPNRAAVAAALERAMPTAWAPEDVWIPPPGEFLPEPRILSINRDFAPDYFMLGCDFVSAQLRDALSPLEEHIRYVPVDARASSDAFLARDYRVAVFPSLTPFEQVFIEAYLSRGPVDVFKPSIRDGFAPPTPIFTVATGPWLMCTRTVVDLALARDVSGISFFDYLTDEEIVPGA